MILFRTEPINVMQRNVMMLDCINTDGEIYGYLYVGKNTYDQCVKLYDKYSSNISYLVTNVLGFSPNQEELELIKYYSSNAPAPVSVLLAFLLFIPKEANLKIGEMEPLFGALHQLSDLIDFNEFTKVDSRIRANVNINPSFIIGYKESWDALTQKVIVEVPQVVQVTNYSNQPANQSTSYVEDYSDGNDAVEEDDPWALLNAAFETLPTDEKKDEEEEKQEVTVKEEPAVSEDTSQKEQEADDIEAVIARFL